MSMTKPAGNPEAPGESRRSRFGCLLTLAVIAFWWYLLHDFVSPPVAIALALAGAALIRGGLYLSVAGARYVFDSVWYAGAWLVGLLMLAGAVATLTPAAPGDLLTSTASGWGLLSGRAARLENAITEGDVELAAKIARRGLGDPAVRDGFGTPVLHYAKDDPEMLGALLEAGLDPDARDGEGRTLLAKGVDDEVRRLLLEAGAAPTPEPGGTAMTPGRDDWLVAAVAGAQPRIPSGISVTPDPLHPGEPGTVTLVVDNPTSQDRLLDVRATLDYAIFLIGASHGGALMDVGIPGTSSTVRWPALALPAGARGELQMRVLARSDDVVPGLLVGDLSIDARVLDLAQRTEEILQHSQQRAGTPARAAITSTAGLLVQLVPSLVVAMVLWVVWRRTRATYSRAPHLRFGRFVAGGAALICAAAAAGSRMCASTRPRAACSTGGSFPRRSDDRAPKERARTSAPCSFTRSSRSRSTPAGSCATPPEWRPVGSRGRCRSSGTFRWASRRDAGSIHATPADSRWSEACRWPPAPA
ncbi:MAG TPA: hypothetical protein PL143_02065 [Rhodocyclaceae bacterium]|nr:hypothetical protein [Rhodocyclaceae bacterium]